MADHIDFKSSKHKRDRLRYNDLVLQTFDDMEHEDKKKVLDRKAEVQIAARERL